MQTKLIVGVIAVVMVVVLFVKALPASRPPLPFDSTAKGGGGGGGGGGGSTDLASLRAELIALKAEIRASNAGGAGGAVGLSPAAGGGGVSERRASCPVCPQCITPKCPKCAAPDAVTTPASAVPAKTGAGSSNAAVRCGKFPIDLPPEIKRLTLQVGAHMGPLQSQGADHAVISFEPQVKFVHRINTEKQLKNVYMIPAAASLYDGVAVFDMSEEHDQSASLNKFNPKIASWYDLRSTTD